MAQKTSPFSNVFLFFGEDDFSLRRKINHWETEFAKKYSAQAITELDTTELSETEIIQSLQQHLSPSLFATKKLIIVRDGLPSKATQTQLADFLLNTISSVPKDFFVIFWQSQRLDGRLAFAKKFKILVTVTEFNLPHGVMLNGWIKAMSKTLGVEITDQAVDRLALFLGRDLFEEKKAAPYNLWQVYTELLKLSANSSKIEKEQVEALVKPKIPDSVFNLTDQVVVKNQKGAFQALENFLSTQTAEEKISLIKVIGLLSDQLRSLLVVGLLKQQGLDQDEIAKKLGWTSGRVFVTSKNLTNIFLAHLKKLLLKLQAIDLRLKSTDTNPSLELDLFLVSATNLKKTQ